MSFICQSLRNIYLLSILLFSAVEAQSQGNIADPANPVFIVIVVVLAVVVIIMLGFAIKFYKIRRQNRQQQNMQPRGSTVSGVSVESRSDPQKKSQHLKKASTQKSSVIENTNQRQKSPIQSQSIGNFQIAFDMIPGTNQTMLQANINQGLGYQGTVYDATLIAQTSMTQTMNMTMINYDSEGPLTIPGFLEIDVNKDVGCNRILAQGGFGEVYDGVILSQNLKDRFPRIEKIAIKFIKPPQSISEEENRIVFDQEVALMWHFDKHPNFIQLVGYSHNPLATVTKLYDFGNLSNLIYGKKSIPNMKYNFYLVLNLGENIAAALAELHSRKIAHNDIKPDNILIDFDYLNKPIAVLCDFSISSIHSEDLLGVKAFRKSQLEGASIHYCPPELLVDPRTIDQEQKLPLAVDVYAFGLLLFEMATRKHPWHKMPQNGIIEAVCTGKRPHIPSQIVQMAMKNEQTSFMLELIARCWAQNPRNRPNINEVVGKLVSINAKLKNKTSEQQYD